MTSTDQMTTRQRQTATFITALAQLNAAGRAQLKRNAGRTLGEARGVHRAFFQAVPFDVPEVLHEDYFLVATLFPLVPHREGVGNLGTTLHRVRTLRGGGDRTNSLDRRVQALLDSDREQLPFRLRQVVRLAAADEQPFDWITLLRDVLAWEWEGHPIQLRWARDYYVGRHDAESAAAS